MESFFGGGTERSGPGVEGKRHAGMLLIVSLSTTYSHGIIDQLQFLFSKPEPIREIIIKTINTKL